MTIDFHTHIFPDKIAQRAIQILEANTENIEGKRVYARTDGTLGGLKRSMAENDIDFSVVMPIATNLTQSTSINNFAAAVNADKGVYSFGSVHPYQEDAVAELERIKQLGLKGIKLHPEYQGVYIDDSRCVEIIRKCMELRLFVMLHTGKDIGIAPPVHCDPKRLRRVLDMTGADNIIAAHMGGWRMWDEAEEYLAGQELYLDTSYSVTMMDKEQVMRMIEKHGADHILYGTDSPWEEQGACRNVIEQLDISDEEKKCIMYKNGVRVLDMKI